MARREKKWVIYTWNREKVNSDHLPLQEMLRLWLNDDETVRRDRERLKEVKAMGLRENKSCCR
ncbi:MAG: hypothetical protein DRI91_03125, partial [Aquificota bacterium]